MRNVDSRFAYAPTSVDTQRSSFNRNFSLKTSFNAGQLIPFLVEEILPGDTYKVKTHQVVRMSSLKTPIMDMLYLDKYYFFVPDRLLWEHWQNFMGQNDSTPWVDPVTYSVPQLTAPVNGWSVGTLADYFGIPTGVGNLTVNALPFRAYCLIFNEWFRDQNMVNPLNWSKNDTTVSGGNGTNQTTDCIKGGFPAKVSKYHDYFTSCLPAPQKGNDVTIPLGVDAPVYTKSQSIPVTNLSAERFKSVNGTTFTGVHDLMLTESTGSGSDKGLLGAHSAAASGTTGIGNGFAPVNLWADLSLATSASINQLRIAFQMQRFLERDARSGSRYREVLAAHFGVHSEDARMQIPEYLGGNRDPLNINQVVQSSSTVAGSPQGNTAAYSLTVGSHYDFTKSFTEHGFLIGLCAVRYHHSYQQGLNRMWSRVDKFDYYWPVFANLGEQPVYNQEIYAQGTSADKSVFGYQEAWADYRYHPPMVTGQMRSTYATSLDIWHLGDDYNSLPTLSESWLYEDTAPVDRVLAVTSAVTNQFLADFYVECQAVRPMPLYSVPGLLDHH